MQPRLTRRVLLVPACLVLISFLCSSSGALPGLSFQFQSLPSNKPVVICQSICGSRGHEALISAKSAFLHMSERRNYQFHFFTDDSEPVKTAFIAELPSPSESMKNVKFNFYTIEDTKSGLQALFQPCSANRLIMPHKLDSSISEYIYVDTDTLWLRDPADLFDLFSDFTGSQELGLAYEVETSEPNGWYHVTPQGERKFYGPTGLNAGVLLHKINYDPSLMWREFEQIMRDHGNNLPLGDQDVLNHYLALHPSHYYKLPCHWNRRSDSKCASLMRGVLHGNRQIFYSAPKPTDPRYEYALSWKFVNAMPVEGFLIGEHSQPLFAGPLTAIDTIKTREDIPSFLQESGMKVGAELGVQRGIFSLHTLLNWPSCTKYVLVDLWSQHSNYEDLANVDTAQQGNITQQMLTSLKRFQDKIEICRNHTTACATQYPDNFFDYIYVDARHDYKGVSEDLVAWWPKLKDGGVFAGHDYVSNDDGPMQSGENWTVNYDGTIDPLGRAVKGAVDDFARSINRQVVVTYREAAWNSWLIRK